MSGKIRLGLGAAALFAATGLVLACGTTIDGRPIVNPVLATEPSPASPPPIQTPPRTTPPSGFPQELDPDAKGSVYIEAESGMQDNARQRSV